MNFKIGKKLIEERYLGCYVVEIKTMYGDADGYGKVIVGGFKKDFDENLMIDLLKTCERMEKAYPNGRSGYDSYNHIEGFNRWFNIEDLDEDIWESLSEHEQNFTGDWESEPGYDECQASYYDYSIFYYDDLGFKYEVNVK